MRTRLARTVAILAATAGLAGLAPAALAQPKPTPPIVGTIRAIEQDGEVNPLAVDIDFPGGTALDYARLLQKGATGMNIAFPDALRQFAIPSLVFRGIDLGTAIIYLDRMQTTTAEGFALVRVSELPSQLGGGEGMWRIDVETSRKRGADAQEQIQRAWSVRELMASMSSDAVLGAVETALSLFGEDIAPPLIRVHEPSGLLLIRGLPEQIDAVQQVLGEMDRSQRSDERTRDAAERLPLLERELVELRNQNTALRDAYERQTATILELEAQRARLTEISLECERLRARADALQAELARVRGGGGEQ